MSIPLDRLYHYIESVAQDIRGDNVLIYRFVPHGSKKIEDLCLLDGPKPWLETQINPQLICFDQEPLNYEFYSQTGVVARPQVQQYLEQNNLKIHSNLRVHPFNVYDKCLLLHSELNSPEVRKYSQDQFVPVYYWSHGLIAQDWFRYAQHIDTRAKDKKSLFLIYNRAWSGTREYRLKFADLLIDNQLDQHCRTWFNSHDNGIHYHKHQFENSAWRPRHTLEKYFSATTANADFSADFNMLDYQQTQVEVVLETLFDDARIQLTEKILRPIALKQPFVLCGATGSLSYLKRYGFKTFEDVWNESYDLITDPLNRMHQVIKTMKYISEQNNDWWVQNQSKINQIVEHNYQHFFSQAFVDQIVSELKHNLGRAFNELENTNTGTNFINIRKILAQNPLGKNYLVNSSPMRDKKDVIQAVKTARKYVNKHQ